MDIENQVTTEEVPQVNGFIETGGFETFKEKMFCYHTEIRHFYHLLIFLESRIPLKGNVSKLNEVMDNTVESLQTFRNEFQDIIEQSLPVPVYSINELFPTQIFKEK